MYHHQRCASQICYIVYLASDPHGPSFNVPVCCQFATPLSHFVIDLQKPYVLIELRCPEEVKAVVAAVLEKRVLTSSIKIVTRVRVKCKS